MLGLSWSMVRSATGQFGQATWVSRFQHSVSTYDMLPTKNALQTMFTKINPVTGALPGSGPPLNQLNFDAYHRWTLIGTCNYHLYTGDDGFI